MLETGPQAFYCAFRGHFFGVMSWEQLDAFWSRMRQRAQEGWFLYAIGDIVPLAPASAEQVGRFIAEIDALLRREHREDYCGIVYADDLDRPTFVKIFDPNNLGVQCGYSVNPPMPGWTLSLLMPGELKNGVPLPGNRRRWWQRMWA